MVLTSGAMAINQALYKQINYNPENDFVPISLYVKSPLILVTNPNLPAKTVPEFINHAKQANPPLSYASVGAGAFQHLSMEFAKQRFGFEATTCRIATPDNRLPISLRSCADSGFVEAGASIPLIKEGRLRALAVSSSTRLPLLPECRRSRKPRVRRTSRRCPGTSCWRRRRRRRTIVDRLHAEMKKIMADPDMKEKTADIGLIPIDTPSVDGMTHYIKSEREKWGALVEKIGLKGRSQ